MCPRPPTALYKSIAENPDAPQELREAASGQMNLQVSMQDTVNTVTTTLNPPSTGNSNFTCTIYDLQNKDFELRLRNAGRLKKGETVANPAAITDFPGIKVWDSNGFAATDPDVNRQKTIDGFRTTYNFYKTVFNRNSIDDQGLEIRASIHCARGYDNAFWSPRDKGYMVFGDGGRFDGRGWLAPTEKELQDKERGWANLSNWFTFYQLDIIGHELTHGVVQYTAALGTQQTAKKQWPEYSEASTLNEHIADCFAIMLKHYVDKTTAETGNWDIGVNFWSDQAVKLQGYTSNYLRTFRIPTDTKSPDSDPKHWDKREDFNTGEKWGLDPHVNCGIANHAFYRAALAFKGNTWEKVGKIWYDALRDDEFKLPEKQTFKGWKDLTVRYAGKHFSTQGTTILENAWKQVGL